MSNRDLPAAVTLDVHLTRLLASVGALGHGHSAPLASPTCRHVCRTLCPAQGRDNTRPGGR